MLEPIRLAHVAWLPCGVLLNPMIGSRVHPCVRRVRSGPAPPFGERLGLRARLGRRFGVGSGPGSLSCLDSDTNEKFRSQIIDLSLYVRSVTADGRGRAARAPPHTTRPERAARASAPTA